MDPIYDRVGVDPPELCETREEWLVWYGSEELVEFSLKVLNTTLSEVA